MNQKGITLTRIECSGMAKPWGLCAQAAALKASHRVSQRSAPRSRMAQRLSIHSSARLKLTAARRKLSACTAVAALCPYPLGAIEMTVMDLQTSGT